MKPFSILGLLVKIFISLILVFFIANPLDAKDKFNKATSKYAGEEIPEWQARWELAKVLSYTKQYDESITEYKKVLQKKPDLYRARAEMANVMFWQGKHSEAIAELEQIPKVKIDEKTKVLMADIYISYKQYQKAEPLLREYLQKQPEDNRARLKLAELLSWTKQYNASLAEYETILKAIPDDIQVRRKYAFVLIWAGRHADAARELRKTLK